MSTTPERRFGEAADALLEKFEHLWDVRDPELIREIVAADAASYWSGQGKVAGSAYPERWDALVNGIAGDLDFTVTGHAAQEPYLYISWHVRATIAGQSTEYDGVDRFRVNGELADEVYVVFDTDPMRKLLKETQRDSASPSA